MAVAEARESAFTSSGLARILDALATIHRDLPASRQRVGDFIAGYLDHPRERVRIGAIAALGQLGHRPSQALLEPLAAPDRQDRVGVAARRAVAAISKQAPLVPEEVVELRKLLDELRDDNRQLRGDVEQLKKQIDAHTAPTKQ